MQLHELAKEIDADVSQLKEFLEKGSHLAGVTDEDIKRAKAQFGSPKAKGKRVPIFFVSLVEKHALSTPNGYVQFEDYKWRAYEDMPVVQNVLKCAKMDQRIMVIKDGRFAEIEDRTKFRKMLENVVFGPNHETRSFAGTKFLQAFVPMVQAGELAKAMTNGAEYGIEWVVDNKHYERIN